MRIGMGDEIVNTFLSSGLGLAGLCGYAARGKQGGAGATAQAPQAQLGQLGHAHPHGRGGGQGGQRGNAHAGAFAHQLVAAPAGQQHKTRGGLTRVGSAGLFGPGGQ